MRARNLKPGFFTNEQLAECSIAARLLFAGLWCMADREGRLEYRPKRIKMSVFPADEIAVEPLLHELLGATLLLKYEVQGNTYAWIPTFAKHQRPHPKEVASTLPPYPGDTQPPLPGGGIRSDVLNPDVLNPLSERDTHSARAREADLGKRAKGLIDEAEHHVMFQRVQKAYPPRAGRSDWLMAENYCRIRIEEGSTWLELLDAVERYAAYVKAGGVSDTGKILAPTTFFSAADKPWKNTWAPPVAIPKVKAKPAPWQAPPEEPEAVSA